MPIRARMVRASPRAANGSRMMLITGSFLRAAYRIAARTRGL